MEADSALSGGAPTARSGPRKPERRSARRLGGAGPQDDTPTLIQQQMPATLAGLLLGIALMTLVFYGDVDAGALLAGWVAGGAAGRLAAAPARSYRAVRRASDAAALDAPLAPAACCSTAALWGASAWLFLDRQTDFHTVALITLIFAYCISAHSRAGDAAAHLRRCSWRCAWCR